LRLHEISVFVEEFFLMGCRDEGAACPSEILVIALRLLPIPKIVAWICYLVRRFIVSNLETEKSDLWCNQPPLKLHSECRASGAKIQTGISHYDTPSLLCSCHCVTP